MKTHQRSKLLDSVSRKNEGMVKTSREGGNHQEKLLEEHITKT